MTDIPTGPLHPGTVLQPLMVALAREFRRRLWSKILRLRVHPTSRIGRSMGDAHAVVLAEGARIAHLTVIRDLRCLDMGVVSTMGSWNRLTAACRFRRLAPTAGILPFAPDRAVTSRHYIACSGGVEIGALPGERSNVIRTSFKTAGAPAGGP